MRNHRAISLVGLVPAAAYAQHGPGTDFAIVLALLYLLALCVVTVPVSMLLPDRSRGHRVGFGVCIPLVAVAVGFAVACLPVEDDTALLFCFGLPALAALALIAFVIKKKYQNADPNDF